MGASAGALVAAAQTGLNALGFVIDEVEERARRIVAFRTGPYSRQELTLQVVGSDRLQATMRLCITNPLVGGVRWQPAGMGLFGIPDEGVECDGQEGLEDAVRSVLGVMEVSVLPLLDRHSGTR